MNIALLSHDNKKKLMENLCIAYRDILVKHKIFATGTTGKLIEEVVNIPVTKYLSGHLGGEKQLSAQLALGYIDLVIFLRDPSRSPPNPGSLMQLCDVHNIPVATNLATAEVLLRALDQGYLDWRKNYSR